MTDGELIRIEHRGAIAIVTLNRPDALNALSKALSSAIGEAFATLQASSETRVAILTGAGRAFCAGMDLKELSSGAASLQAQADEIGAGHRRFGLAAFDRPVIAAINGFAITGGLELAMACDIRIAARSARFADTHARVGVIPGGGMSVLLPRLIGPGRARIMSLSGDPIDAETAERWGLVDRVVEAEELLPACLGLAEKIATNDRDILHHYNALISENLGMPLPDAIDNEHRRSRDANQRFDRGSVDQAELAGRARRS